jgi:tagatose-6-phosphate ketose/aldose isomerase
LSAGPHLGLAADWLEARGAHLTAQEIARQPAAWRDTHALLAAERARIDAFLRPALATPGLRIILAGAGSSAYIGQCLAPVLLRKRPQRVEAIGTTDLVARPLDWLQRDVPTLLVSFARSGNSPESVAALELADRCVARCWHFVITCNAGGELYRRASAGSSSLALALPESTHDAGFAMTASFSSMYYAALATLGGDGDGAADESALAAAGAAVLAQLNTPLRELAGQSFERAVFLGSGPFAGLASEAALKLLELTDGGVATMANTPLGFRHGPKTIVNRATLVALFIASDPHARRYDLDLLGELRRDAAAGALVAIAATPDSTPADPDIGTSPDKDGAAVRWLRTPGTSGFADAELVLPFALVAQLYAFHSSLRRGLRPDTPCASGRVHRVVQGVTIHPL